MRLAFWRKPKAQNPKESFRLWYQHRLLCETSDTNALALCRNRWLRNYPNTQTYITNGLGGEYFDV